MKLKTTTRALYIQLGMIAVGLIASFAIGYFTVNQDLKPHQVVILAMGALLAAERIGAAFAQHSIRHDIKDAQEKSERLLESLVETRAFDNSHTAHEYVVDRLPACASVLNTSMRAGSELVSMDAYYSSEEIEARYAALQKCLSKGCVVKEVVSDNLGQDTQKRFVEMGKPRNYYIGKIASTTLPLTNFIILDYGHGDREVLFGWNFSSKSTESLVFQSSNGALVTYFEQRFTYLLAASVDLKQ